MMNVSKVLVFFTDVAQGCICKKVMCGLAFLLLSSMLHAQELQVSNLFSDHMVLQREMQVPIWGLASPGEKIAISFADQLKTTKTGPNGEWKVELDALDTSKIGRSMTIFNTLFLTNNK